MARMIEPCGERKKFPKFLAIQLANFIEQIFLLSLLTNNFSNLFLPNNSAVKNVLSKKKKKEGKMHKNKKYIRTMNYERLYVYPYRRPPANKTTLQQSSILFCRRSEPTTVLRVNGSNPLLPGCLISALFHWLNKERPAVIMRIREETRAGL